MVKWLARAKTGYVGSTYRPGNTSAILELHVFDQCQVSCIHKHLQYLGEDGETGDVGDACAGAT